MNEDDGNSIDNPLTGNIQGGYQKALLPGFGAVQGVGIRKRRDGRRKKRTNPDRLLIAEHIQLKRQRSRDRMINEGGSSGEVSSGTSDLEDETTLGTSVASTVASSRTESRSNSPNSQTINLNEHFSANDKRKFGHPRKKGRGRKEWER